MSLNLPQGYILAIDAARMLNKRSTEILRYYAKQGRIRRFKFGEGVGRNCYLLEEILRLKDEQQKVTPVTEEKEN